MQPNPLRQTLDHHGIALDAEVVAALRTRLPVTAERAVDAIAVQVAEYAGQMTGEFRSRIEAAVQLALGGFLRLAEQAADSDAGTPLDPVLDDAYALGRGEARSGRTMSALLAAYRLGARIAWQEWSAQCVEVGMSAEVLARFAELMFSYIDALSAASVTGHSDQLAVSGRVRDQYRERLAQAVLAGEAEERVRVLAERAEWPLPESLTAVVVRASDARNLHALLGPDTLVLPGDVVGWAGDASVLLAGGQRRALLDALSTARVIVGPTRPWREAAASLERARRLFVRHGLRHRSLDTDQHLVELVVSADEDALRDLRERALRPLAGVRPATAGALVDTLRSWLLHQGRRESVAADLLVHPQTVRYRMSKIRALFGEALNDPDQVMQLTVALAVPPVARSPRTDSGSPVGVHPSPG